MGCQRSHQKDYHHHHAPSGNCVKGTVHQIIRAQRKAAERDTTTCLTSCERSIDDLLSPTEDRKKPKHTTIPFMLICKDGCKNFIGSGVVKKETLGREYFECVESPIFKVRGFVRGSDNCVKLELLLPIKSLLPPRTTAEEETELKNHESTSCNASTPSTPCSPCNYFATTGLKKVYGFKETGVCITVDLNSFSGITCLDPITPEKA